jgi:hypothetical protein
MAREVIMQAMATCAFCGEQAPASAMDLTGHGLRCVQCAARSELAAADGHTAGMAEHLTREELEDVVSGGTTEAVLGAMLAVGGALATVVSIAAGVQIIVVFTGAMAVGLGMLGHGLYRRKHAAAAIRNAPDARVVTRSSSNR